MRPELIQLSQKAIGICDTTRGKNYTGCRKCPIIKECHSGSAGDAAAINAWVKRVNEAAESVTK